MTKRTDIETMIHSTITVGTDHMMTMRGAHSEDEYTDAAAALADTWVRLVQLTERLIKEQQ